MASTIKQRLRRYNGTDYDSIYLSANVGDVVGTLSTANGGTGNSSVDTTPTSGSTKMVTSGGIYTEINTLKTSVSEGKAAIASAITDKGVSTASDASFSTMATNIGSINTRIDGTLDSGSRMLSGYTAYGSGGTKYTGDIATKTSSNVTANNNTVTIPAGYYASQVSKTVGTAKATATYTPGTSDQTISSGYYLTGNQTIKGDSNLVASNIKSGASIFGVAGTYSGSSPTISLIKSGGSNWHYITSSSTNKITTLSQTAYYILIVPLYLNTGTYYDAGITGECFSEPRTTFKSSTLVINGNISNGTIYYRLHTDGVSVYAYYSHSSYSYYSVMVSIYAVY